METYPLGHALVPSRPLEHGVWIYPTLLHAHFTLLNISEYMDAVQTSTTSQQRVLIFSLSLFRNSTTLHVEVLCTLTKCFRLDYLTKKKQPKFVLVSDHNNSDQCA